MTGWANLDDATMSFGDHLEELRARILLAVRRRCRC